MVYRANTLLCDDLHAPEMWFNCNNMVGRIKESIRSAFPQFVSLIMVCFHSNFQIIFNSTSSIDVTTLAPYFLIWTMLTSPFKEENTLLKSAQITWEICYYFYIGVWRSFLSKRPLTRMTLPMPSYSKYDKKKLKSLYKTFIPHVCVGQQD